MVQGAIKLTITTDARQTEKQLAQLEQQVKVVKDLERENAALSKSHAQAATSAQKAAQAVDSAFSKLQAARAKQEQYAAALREQFNFGGNLSRQGFASPEEAAGAALSTDKKYQQMSTEVARLTAELEGLREAQATAEVSEADLGEKVSDTTQRLSEERAKLSSYQETHKKTAAALGNTSKKLDEISRKSKKAASGLSTIKKQSIPLTKSIFKLSNMLQLMLIRMVMRKAIDSVKKGFENLAQYSAAFNGTMSRLSTASLYLSNALATVFKPVLEAIAPVIEGISEKLVAVSNAVAAFTASLFGNATTYTKAKKAAVDYAKAITGTTKKNEKALASFDEINKLTFDDNSGLPKPEDMFEEEEIDETVTSMTDKIKDMLTGWEEAARPTVESFKNLTAALEPLKTFAAEGLKDFYKSFLQPVGHWVLGEGLPRLLDITSSLARQIDWNALNGALDRFWKALQPLAQKVGEGLLWFYENVIAPLVKWAMNVLIPKALDLVSAALEALDPVIEALKPWALWLWENFLQPLGEWTGTIIINAIQWLTDRLNEFADWARENPESFRTIFEIIIGGLTGLLVYKALDFINKLGPALVAFAAQLDTAKLSAGLAAIGFGAFFAALIQIAENWDQMNLSEKMLSIVGALYILTGAALAAAFATGALQSALTLGLAAAAIVAGIVAVSVAISSAQKRAQQASANLKMAPNTYSAASMPSTYNIPRFATGAVVPPRNEFLAVMGDNKQEREFVAPESAMKQTFMDAIAESGLLDQRGGGDIVLQVNGRTFARITNPYNAAESSRRGMRLVKGGGF